MKDILNYTRGGFTLYGGEGLDTRSLYTMMFGRLGLDGVTRPWFEGLATSDPETLEMRNEVLRDLLENPDTVTAMRRLHENGPLTPTHGGAYRQESDLVADLEALNVFMQSFESVNDLRVALNAAAEAGKLHSHLSQLQSSLQEFFITQQLDVIYEKCSAALAGCVFPHALTLGVNLDENLRITGYKLLNVKGENYAGMLASGRQTLTPEANNNHEQTRDDLLRATKTDFDDKTAQNDNPLAARGGLFGLQHFLKYNGFGMFYDRTQPLALANLSDTMLDGEMFNGQPNVANLRATVKKIVDVCLGDSRRDAAALLRKISTEVSALRRDIAFYLGALNLIEQLTQNNMPYCFAAVAPKNSFEVRGLYLPLLLYYGKSGGDIVKNDIILCCGAMTFLTGPNQGGKTTLLKAVGMAQLMFQMGLPVCGEVAAIGICRGVSAVFTAGDEHNDSVGRLHQELRTLSSAVDSLEDGSLVLLNEPLTGTSQRDSEEICLNVLNILRMADAHGVWVTHLHEFAAREYARGCESLVALSENGKPTYRVKSAPPCGKSLAYEVIIRKGIDI